MSAFVGRINCDRHEIDQDAFKAAKQKISKFGREIPPIISNHFALAAVHSESSPYKAAPPLSDRSPTLVVADALIDNRSQLLTMLGKPVENSRRLSDAEIIKMAFDRWGEECVQRIHGDYSFGCYTPATDEIFLARDHIGSRPLYWALRDKQLIFGSSIESIVSFPDFEWKIDELVVAEYLACPITPVSKPFFEHIYTVPAGSFLKVYKGKSQTTRWWKPSVNPKTSNLTAGDAVRSCRVLLDQAVENCSRSTKRVGSHLSGGIDSTGVAVIASRRLKDMKQELAGGYAWSPGFSELYPIQEGADEREFIQRVADTEGIAVKFGAADTANFLDFVARPFEFENEADLADELPVLRQAQQDGVGVILSGWGGDEVFSTHGRGILGFLVKTGQFARARKMARHTYRSPNRIRNLMSFAWRELIHPVLPNRLYHRWHPSTFFRGRTSFAGVGLRRRFSNIFKSRVPTVKFGLDPNENMKRHLEAGHVTMRMESWAHWSASYGIQYRYPLLNRQLLEFLFKLPPEFLFLNAQRRGLAKAVLEDCVPREASKNDVINEKLRANVRTEVWQRISEAVRKGYYADDCPWINKDAFFAAASSPQDQSKLENLETYIEVLAAARVWELNKRAREFGWL